MPVDVTVVVGVVVEVVVGVVVWDDVIVVVTVVVIVVVSVVESHRVKSNPGQSKVPSLNNAHSPCAF